MAKSTSILKDKKFENTTELVAFLKENFVWKIDPEIEHIYILDKSGSRNVSKEFEIKETKSGNLYLSEV